LAFWVFLNLYRITSFAPSADTVDLGFLAGGVKPDPIVKDEDNNAEKRHRVAGLSCPAFSNPQLDQKRYTEAQEEIVFWKDIPKDSHAVSPYKCSPTAATKKYLTFEPDEGGWNNM
jgi:hypothetical protein